MFLLLSPEEEHGLQLQIMAGLAHVLADEDVRRRVRAAASDAELWRTLTNVLRPKRTKPPAMVASG